MTEVLTQAWIAQPVVEATPEDIAAVRAAVVDYFEGWFEGDPVRMARALHSGLAKHSLGQDATRSEVLEVTTRDEMVEVTEQGGGRLRDSPERRIGIDIAGLSGDIASVVVDSDVFVEYVLLVRTGDGWRITSTLWQWAVGHGPRA
jgi:Putative lumazine-binding